ncbi:hypothetical protein ERJ75_001036800 [Trypanosoma vivax]|nr:hypothetical protein ERJ75_001036800 [Trypanosoma vivax]
MATRRGRHRETAQNSCGQATSPASGGAALARVCGGTAAGRSRASKTGRPDRRPSSAREALLRTSAQSELRAAEPPKSTGAGRQKAQRGDGRGLGSAEALEEPVQAVRRSIPRRTKRFTGQGRKAANETRRHRAAREAGGAGRKAVARAHVTREFGDGKSRGRREHWG